MPWRSAARSRTACSRLPSCTRPSTAGAGARCSMRRRMRAWTRRRRGACSRRAATASWPGSTTGPTGAWSRRWRTSICAKLPVRRRIALLVRARLELLTPHREAVRRAVAAHGLPGNLAGTGRALVAHGRPDVADGRARRRPQGRLQLLFAAGHAGGRAGHAPCSTGSTTSRPTAPRAGPSSTAGSRA